MSSKMTNDRQQEWPKIFDERLTKRPGNRNNIEQVKPTCTVIASSTACDLFGGGLRTQTSLTGKIEVGKNRISQIELGNILWARVKTLHEYLQVFSADLEIYLKRAD